MTLVDYKSPLIERDIGDPHGRTPHFVQDTESLDQGDLRGVLYIPDAEARVLEWKARAFYSPEDAIKFLNRVTPGLLRTNKRARLRERLK